MARQFMRDPRLRGLFQRQLGQQRRRRAQPMPAPAPTLQQRMLQYQQQRRPQAPQAGQGPRTWQAPTEQQVPTQQTKLTPTLDSSSVANDTPVLQGPTSLQGGTGLTSAQLQTLSDAQLSPPSTTIGDPTQLKAAPIPTSPVRQLPGVDKAPPNAQAINKSQGQNRAPAWGRGGSSGWMNRFMPKMLGKGQQMQNTVRNRSNEQPGLAKPSTGSNYQLQSGPYTKGRGM